MRLNDKQDILGEWQADRRYRGVEVLNFFENGECRERYTAFGNTYDNINKYNLNFITKRITLYYYWTTDDGYNVEEKSKWKYNIKNDMLTLTRIDEPIYATLKYHRVESTNGFEE